MCVCSPITALASRGTANIDIRVVSKYPLGSIRLIVTV